VNDEAYMERALALAERGRGRVCPNPMVGVVLVRDGRIVGEGWHEGPGTAHAEVRALDAAEDSARGATLYTTLEPCDHDGRTPPCTDAIASAGVGRVVAAIRDPNPMVDGRGLARLERAGIEIRTGPLESEVSRQLEAYVHHVRTGRPFVTVKMAASLDGKVAARDGTSRWITGEEARADVHRLRAASDAIVVGAGTALADDPALTVRDPSYRGAQPLRVLTDATGRVPATGDLFDGSAPTLVATSEEAPGDRRQEWRAAGAETLVLETDGAGVRLDALLEHLGKREVQAVLVEGGPTLAWSAIRDGLVDKVVVYLAPILIGGRDAPGILEGEGFAPIADAPSLDVLDVGPIGRDLRVEAYVHRHR